MGCCISANDYQRVSPQDPGECAKTARRVRFSSPVASHSSFPGTGEADRESPSPKPDTSSPVSVPSAPLAPAVCYSWPTWRREPAADWQLSPSASSCPGPAPLALSPPSVESPPAPGERQPSTAAASDDGQLQRLRRALSCPDLTVYDSGTGAHVELTQSEYRAIGGHVFDSKTVLHLPPEQFRRLSMSLSELRARQPACPQK